jgi:hypothetical protein
VRDSLFEERAAARVDEGLPLRASTVAEDGNYDPKTVGLSDKIAVLLNGEELPEASGWDVVAGEIVRKRRDNLGHVRTEGGRPTYETLRGRVEVRWIRQPETHRHA